MAWLNKFSLILRPMAIKIAIRRFNQYLMTGQVGFIIKVNKMVGRQSDETDSNHDFLTNYLGRIS